MTSIDDKAWLFTTTKTVNVNLTKNAFLPINTKGLRIFFFTINPKPNKQLKTYTYLFTRNSTNLFIMADKQTSTLQSYIDSATGAVQAAVGNLTGNTADQVRIDSSSIT